MKAPTNIFWDFDGVLMNSNGIRDLGFERVLDKFPAEQVQQLLIFHRQNGGLSRYVKFRYFFEEIRKEVISENHVKLWAEKFSKIMYELLLDETLLISETLDFVKAKHKEFNMHIVSGSDQDELRFICKSLNIDHYFKSINGSPRPKKEWVQEIVSKEKYIPEKCLLIGDSINDYEAAMSAQINFMAYNNSSINHLSTQHILLV